MDRARSLLERHVADREQRDRSEQRDAGSVERHVRQPAQDHSQVDDAEDDDDQRGHAADDACVTARF